MNFKKNLNESLYGELCALLKKVDKTHTLNLIVENGNDVKVYQIFYDSNISISKNIIKIDNGNFLVVIPIEKIISCVFFELN